MIRIDDDGDGEHAGVRQDLEVDGYVSAFADCDRNGRADLVSAECYRLGGTADMRHQRMESGWWFMKKRYPPSLARNRITPPRIAIGGGPVAADLWARTAASTRSSRSDTLPRAGTSTSIGLTIADGRTASGMATGDRHSEGNRIDWLSPAQQVVVQCAPTATSTASFVVAPMRCRTQQIAIHSDDRHPSTRTRLSYERAQGPLAVGEVLRRRTSTAAGTARTGLLEGSRAAGPARHLEQGLAVSERTDGRTLRQAARPDQEARREHSVHPRRLPGRGVTRQRPLPRHLPGQ